MVEQNRLDKNVLLRDWPLLAVIGAMFAGGLVAYPHLPELVPSHFAAGGEPDAFASRLWGAFGIPLLALGIYLLMAVVPSIDPRRANYALFPDTYRKIRAAIILFMVPVYALVLSAGLGLQTPIGVVMPVALGVLFLLLGGYMSRIPFNYFLGIRTPWTLADEGVWRTTHQKGGMFFSGAGVVAILSVSLPSTWSYVVTVGAVVGAVLGSFLYSYLVYASKNRTR